MKYLLFTLAILFSYTAYTDEAASDNEIRFTSEITGITQRCRSDGPCTLFFKDILVVYEGCSLFKECKVKGKISYPIGQGAEETYKTSIRVNIFPSPPEQFIGKTADVYCILSENTSTEFEGKACSIIGKYEYFIKIHPK